MEKIKETISLTAVLFFAWAGFGYCQPSFSLIGVTKTAEEYYSEGKGLILKGEYRQALEAFKKAELLLNNNPDSPDRGPSRQDIGRVDSYQEIQPQENKVKATKNPAVKPSVPYTSSKDLLERANLAYKLGRLDEALLLYQKASKRHPNNRNIQYNIGALCLARQDYGSAADAFKKVISLNRRDEEAYYNLGVIYENFLNDHSRAIKYYTLYIRYAKSKSGKEVVKNWVEYIKKRDIR